MRLLRTTVLATLALAAQCAAAAARDEVRAPTLTEQELIGVWSDCDGLDIPIFLNADGTAEAGMLESFAGYFEGAWRFETTDAGPRLTLDGIHTVMGEDWDTVPALFVLALSPRPDGSFGYELEAYPQSGVTYLLYLDVISQDKRGALCRREAAE